MAIISKLAFILDSKVDDPRAIVRGCLAHIGEGEEAFWKVYPGAGPSGFIRRLFLLAELGQRTLLRLRRPARLGEPPAKVGPLLVSRDDPDYAFLIDYLIDVKTQLKRYKTLPRELTDFSHLHLLQPVGEKNRARLFLAERAKAEAFAFIDQQDFTQLTGFAQIPDDPSGVAVKKLRKPIKTGALFDVQTLSALAERVRRYECPTYSWQDLYLKTLLPQLKVPETRIPLDAIEQDRPGMVPHEARPGIPQYPRRLDLCEALERRRVVLLTGAGGSGKTTTLRVLAAELASQWLRQRRKGGKKQAGSPVWFPIVLELAPGQATGDVDLGKIVAQNVISVLNCCTREDLARSESVAKLPGAPSMSSEQMLLTIV